jgi:uncharacterized protein DUF262
MQYWRTNYWWARMALESPLSLFDEDEEDVETSFSPELRAELREIVVYNLDWTVETVLTQLEGGAIDLQPQYQRRDAWTIARKSKLIESLVLGLPVPHIVLAERHDQKGSFLVLDGKQRLTTLAQFTGRLPSTPANRFALVDLPLLGDIEGVTFDQLVESESLRQIRQAFLNQAVRTAIVRGWKSDDLLHIIFHRLNSQVVPLSTQELRQALIRGPFMVFLNDYSAGSTTIRWLLRIDGPDFRMRDSELLLRLLGLTRFAEEYRGDLRKFLDKLARRLSNAWDEHADFVKGSFREIEDALELWGQVIGRENVGRKFLGETYEGRLNRAVLDAEVFAARDEAVAKRIRKNPAKAKRELEKLMTKDDDFRRAIEATTKSLEAVRYRMDRLHSVLAKV